MSKRKYAYKICHGCKKNQVGCEDCEKLEKLLDEKLTAFMRGYLFDNDETENFPSDDEIFRMELDEQ